LFYATFPNKNPIPHSLLPSPFSFKKYYTAPYTEKEDGRRVFVAIGGIFPFMWRVSRYSGRIYAIAL